MFSIPRLLTTTIVVHHSVTPQHDSQAVAISKILAAHKAKGLAYDGNPAYHVIIGDGWEALVRPENSIGYHAGNWIVNTQSVAVCMVGNFDVDKLTPYQEEKLAKQILVWQQKYKLTNANVKLHKEVRIGGTACPGANNTKLFVLGLVEKWRPANNPLMPRVNEAIREAGSEPARIIDNGARTVSAFWQEWVKAGKVTKYSELVDDIKGRIKNKEYPHENGN